MSAPSRNDDILIEGSMDNPTLDIISALKPLAGARLIEPQLFQTADGTMKVFPVRRSTNAPSTAGFPDFERYLELVTGQAGVRDSAWRPVNESELGFAQSANALSAYSEAANRVTKLGDLFTARAQQIATEHLSTMTMPRILQVNAASAVAGLYKSELGWKVLSLANSMHHDPAAAKESKDTITDILTVALMFSHKMVEEFPFVFDDVDRLDGLDVETLNSRVFQSKTPSEIIDHLTRLSLESTCRAAAAVTETFVNTLRRSERQPPPAPDPQLVELLATLLRGKNVSHPVSESECPSLTTTSALVVQPAQDTTATEPAFNAQEVRDMFNEMRGPTIISAYQLPGGPPSASELEADRRTEQGFWDYFDQRVSELGRLGGFDE